MERLTTELWGLYLLIKSRTEKGLKTTVQDVCELMPNQYTLNAKECNFSNCPKLYQDVDTLNESEEIEKIIVKDHNNFHLATEEEIESYLNRLKERGVKAMKKYWVIQRKADNDGQGKLISCHDQPIDEKSKARRFVDAFVHQMEIEDGEIACRKICSQLKREE